MLTRRGTKHMRRQAEADRILPGMPAESAPYFTLQLGVRS